MPLDKLNAFTKKVQDLADKPNSTMSAAEVKAQFDAAPNELRLAFNQLIDDLGSVVDGDSGADNVAVTAIAGLTGLTIQAVLEELKVLDDSNRAYLLSQIQNTVIGQIPDGSITDVKLSNDPADIKPSFATHKADDTSHVKYGADTGTANAKVVTLSFAPASYIEGMALAFKNAVQNTGAVTINVNGLGAIPVLKSNGNALASGNLKANSVYTLRYNGTSFILQGEGGEYGTAVAGDVLTGKTIGTENGIINGTLTPGKKFASGTVTSGTTGVGILNNSGLTNTRFALTLPILDFVPSFVIAFQLSATQSDNNSTIYSKDNLSGYSIGANFILEQETIVPSYYKPNATYLISTTAGGVNKLPVLKPGVGYTFRAYE